MPMRFPRGRTPDQQILPVRNVGGFTGVVICFEPTPAAFADKRERAGAVQALLFSAGRDE